MQLIPRVKQNAAIQISELEKTLLSIRQARDSLVSQVHNLSQNQESAKLQIEALMHEVEEVRETFNINKSELESSRRDCEELRADLLKHENNIASNTADGGLYAELATETDGISKFTDLEAQLAAAKARVSGLEAQIERSAEQHKESNGRLIQKLISAENDRATITKIADSTCEQLAAMADERDFLAREVKTLEARVSILQIEVERLSQGDSSEEQIRTQQQQIADLSSQLDAARDELRLAWTATQSSEHIDEAAPALEGEPELPPLNGAEAEDEVSKCLANLYAATGSSEPEKHMKALEENLQHFAQRALVAGWLSTRRTLELCGEIARWIQKFPSKLELMVQPLTDALLLICKVGYVTNPSVHAETEGLEIYAVDDDMDNCECIAMSLEKVALRTHYASKVEVALNHLASNENSLIILDVDLGGNVNGFEIHTSIRNMPHHKQTPILFVSALTSARARVEKTASRNDSYLAKPYNLYELSLRALCMIVGSRLPAEPAALPGSVAEKSAERA